MLGCDINFLKIDTKIKQVTVLFIINVVVLFLARFILFSLYPQSFEDLTFIEMINSFLVGAKIDIITICTFNFIFILFLLTPFKFTYNLYYRYFFGFLWFLIMIAILFIDIADILYFPFVNRHITGELIAMMNDLSTVPVMMFDTYLTQTILLTLGVMLLFFVWHKILTMQLIVKDTRFLDFLVVPVVFVLLFIGARGMKVSGKAFNVSDAYTTSKISSANLAISGFYSIYRNFYNSTKPQKYKFMDSKVAISNVQKLITTKKTNFVDAKYPLKREFHKKETKDYNVVIIMLESFSSKFVDSFNGNIGLKVTPNLDNYANNGLKFTNFYANGQRSLDGITALFTGIANPSTNTYLGRGLEGSKLSYLGNLAKQNGYSTISMQSSNRNSFRFDSISKVAGFDQYYGAEDFTKNVNGEDLNKKPLYGTWDGDMLSHYFNKINEIKKPFLSFAFTSTSHFPFVLPGEKWKQYSPHVQEDSSGMLNTMKYTDDMLGVFIQRCKKEPWFKDTIFVFMADHTAGLWNISIDNINKFSSKYKIKFPNRLEERYKIPLVVYAPHIFKAKEIKTLTSQADIIPSLVDKLGWNSSFSTISNSIFDENIKNRFVISKAGDSYIMITDDSITHRNLTKKSFQHGEKDLSNDIFSIHQVMSELLMKNKVY